MSQLGQITIVLYVSQLQSIFLTTGDLSALSVTKKWSCVKHCITLPFQSNVSLVVHECMLTVQQFDYMKLAVHCLQNE